MSLSNLFRACFLPALFLLFHQQGLAQTRPVSGRVTDSTGTGLSGVTVTVKGTSTATNTNAAGAFSLTAPAS
ncbi:MAG TPA: carboxypeptidase-like regulatory domain-containing protein, partial [Chitinophagaceae bacterium]|nr:carboxypeptidase-like regulatory domain-containing protein [Chitinophagaceae bacterium]